MRSESLEKKINTSLAEYCCLRYSHEQQLKVFKKQFKNIIKIDKEIITSNLLDIKLLNYPIDVYLNVSTLYRLDLIDFTPDKISIGLYDKLISVISESCSSIDLEKYIENKISIIDYYEKHARNYLEIRKIKESQFSELREVSKKLISLGYYVSDANIQYNLFKLDLNMKKRGPEVYNEFNEIYDSIKDRLLNNMIRIRREQQSLIKNKGSI